MILGPRERRKALGSGEFYCPQCRQQGEYELLQYRSYFHVLFVPLFPIGAERVRVACRRCEGEFPISALQSAAPEREPVESRTEGSRSGPGARQFNEPSRPRLQAGKGERILGRWDFFWYPGVVSKRDAKGVHVLFDDGDEATLAPSLVQAMDIRTGERVYARWHGGNTYAAGTIAEMDGERIHVHYEDGRKEWTTVSVIRVVRGEIEHPWKEGDRVLALWPPDPLFFPGTIQNIQDRIFFAIEFDDGTKGMAYPDQVMPLHFEEGDLIFAPSQNRPGLEPAWVGDVQENECLVDFLSGGRAWLPLANVAKLPPSLEENFLRQNRLKRPRDLA